MKELFAEIAANYDIVIDAMEVAADHVYLFVSFSPRYSIARVARLFKSISASVLFQEFPELKSRLWGGEFRENGYFVRTVGDEVTVEVIRKYILYHG